MKLLARMRRIADKACLRVKTRSSGLNKLSLRGFLDTQVRKIPEKLYTEVMDLGETLG